MKAFVSKVLMLATLLGVLSSPSFAESKSHTVHVSCIVMPEMQITSTQPGFSIDSVRIQSNFGEQFNTSEGWRISGGQKTKLYTVTAL
jgi:hypothetical protein